MATPKHRAHLLPGAALLALLLQTGCAPAADPIDPEGKTFDAVAPDARITLSGTEPFWGLTIAGGTARYLTPDHPEGMEFAVTRFAGNGGLGFSGMLDGAAVTVTLTPGACSDGMSDRKFPYVATVALGGETLRGCGYTDQQPFAGDAAP